MRRHHARPGKARPATAAGSSHPLVRLGMAWAGSSDLGRCEAQCAVARPPPLVATQAEAGGMMGYAAVVRDHPGWRQMTLEGGAG